MSRLGPEHSRIQALLSAYLDGEISPREQSAVEEHLEGCDLCTEELLTLRQTVEMLHTLPAVAPRRSFTLRHLPVQERRSWWAW
ncbi:MAG: anti-sigma factor family protein, partial [Anaerolineae bacterium]